MERCGKPGASFVSIRKAPPGSCWNRERSRCARLPHGASGADPPSTGRIGLRLRGLADDRRLFPHLSAECGEDVHLLAGPSSRPLSLAIQTWELADLPDRSQRIRCRLARIVSSRGARIDIDYLAALLHRHLSIVPLRTGMLETGLGLLGAPLPGAPVPAAYRLSRRDTRPASARKLLSAQAFAMRANTAGTRHDRDIEYLHDLRVATRRARFLVRLYGDVLGTERSTVLRSELAWIGGLLGTVRDLDVFLQNLPARLREVEALAEAAAEVSRASHASREAAFASLAAALDSGRYRALLAALAAPIPDASAAAPDSLEAPVGLADFAGRQIHKAVQRLTRLGLEIARGSGQGSEPAPRELHRARILFKRLRYTCEFFSPLFAKDLRGAIRGLVAYQDCLGAHQDAVTALRLLEQIAKERGAGESRRTRRAPLRGRADAASEEDSGAGADHLRRHVEGVSPPCAPH